jgi:outer membrane receptor protein involved in Fe transport
VQNSTVIYSGNYIPLVPNQTLGLAGNYRIPIQSNLLDDLSVNLQYTGTGKLYWAENNKFTQPYSGILNGKITATKGIAQISLWAKNITDTEYAAYWFAIGAQQYAQKGRPLTAGVSVNLTIQ